MRKSIILGGFVLISFLYGCRTETNCTVEAKYWGDFVCLQEDLAAAVILDETANHYLILSNFFEFIDLENISQGDPIAINYSTPDSNLFNSGILCGAMLVAPVANLECFEQL